MDGSCQVLSLYDHPSSAYGLAIRFIIRIFVFIYTGFRQCPRLRLNDFNLADQVELETARRETSNLETHSTETYVGDSSGKSYATFNGICRGKALATSSADLIEGFLSKRAMKKTLYHPEGLFEPYQRLDSMVAECLYISRPLLYGTISRVSESVLNDSSGLIKIFWLKVMGTLALFIVG